VPKCDVMEINSERHTIHGDYKNHIFNYVYEKHYKDDNRRKLIIECYFADDKYLYESRKQFTLTRELSFKEIEKLIKAGIKSKCGWEFRKEKCNNFPVNDKVRPISECSYLNIELEKIPLLWGREEKSE